MMETVPTKNGRPDIDAIMARIREEVRQAVDRGETKPPPYRPAQSGEGASKGQGLIESEELRYLNHHWSDWSVVEEITSHRKIIGPLIVRVKRFVLDAVRNNLLRGYFDRERQFQMSLVRHLNSSAKHIDARDYEIFWELTRRIENDIVGLNERMDRLFGEVLSECRTLERELRQEIQALKNELAQSESRKVSAVG